MMIEPLHFRISPVTNIYLFSVIDYKIYPQNCTAYDGGWALVNTQVKHVPLWTYEK